MDDDGDCVPESLGRALPLADGDCVSCALRLPVAQWEADRSELRVTGAVRDGVRDAVVVSVARAVREEEDVILIEVQPLKLELVVAVTVSDTLLVSDTLTLELSEALPVMDAVVDGDGESDGEKDGESDAEELREMALERDALVHALGVSVVTAVVDPVRDETAEREAVTEGVLTALAQLVADDEEVVQIEVEAETDKGAVSVAVKQTLVVSVVVTLCVGDDESDRVSLFDSENDTLPLVVVLSLEDRQELGDKVMVEVTDTLAQSEGDAVIDDVTRALKLPLADAVPERDGREVAESVGNDGCAVADEDRVAREDKDMESEMGGEREDEGERLVEGDRLELLDALTETLSDGEELELFVPLIDDDVDALDDGEGVPLGDGVSVRVTGGERDDVVVLVPDAHRDGDIDVVALLPREMEPVALFDARDADATFEAVALPPDGVGVLRTVNDSDGDTLTVGLIDGEELELIERLAREERDSDGEMETVADTLELRVSDTLPLLLREIDEDDVVLPERVDDDVVVCAGVTVRVLVGGLDTVPETVMEGRRETEDTGELEAANDADVDGEVTPVAHDDDDTLTHADNESDPDALSEGEGDRVSDGDAVSLLLS